MSSPNSPARLGDLATSRTRISRRDMTLPGISDNAANRRALIRLPNGRTVSIRTGDRLGTDGVAAIEDGRIILQRKSSAVALTFPPR
ncbi:hypothetical protein AAD018_011090 [Aestuariibius insulae]|uniref:hypothetical protein n=1 Tax=Aestuariibius insulae TaxID=2058287 RepID=UPI00345E153E